MKKALNNKIRKIVEGGNYFQRQYYETLEMAQDRMSATDYGYYTTTADDIFHFFTMDKCFEMNVSEFDWRILWDKLGNVPTNENDEIEIPFEHFCEGSEKYEIWNWFEWMFNVKLGDEIYK
jgi:hypothetical protein